MALEDAVVLGQVIDSEATLAQALETFMPRRFERVKLVVETSVKLGQLEQQRLRLRKMSRCSPGRSRRWRSLTDEGRMSQRSHVADRQGQISLISTLVMAVIITVITCILLLGRYAPRSRHSTQAARAWILATQALAKA